MRKLLGLPGWLLAITTRVLVVVLTMGAFGPAGHDVHEDECTPAFVAHDASQHRVEAATRSPETRTAEHCVACHFARSSRGPVSWEPSGLNALDRGVLLYHRDGELRTAPSAAPLPARAPPSLS